MNLYALTLNRNPTLPAAILGHPCDIEGDASAPNAALARLFQGWNSAGKYELCFDSMNILRHTDRQPFERLQNIDRKWADLCVHTFPTQMSRNAQIMLYAVDGDSKSAIHNIQMGIDAERDTEETIIMGRKSIEEITVI